MGSILDTYQLAIEARQGYLRASVRGPNTPETIRRYTSDIREACQRLQQRNVLLVVDLHGPSLSLLDVYKVVSSGSDEVAGLGLRVAYVDANPAHAVENMHLAEDVATTRGIPVRTFRDAAAAEAWLLGKATPALGA